MKLSRLGPAFTANDCSHDLDFWRSVDINECRTDKRTGALRVVVGHCRACGPRLVRKYIGPDPRHDAREDSGDRFKPPVAGGLRDRGHGGPPSHESDIGKHANRGGA